MSFKTISVVFVLMTSFSVMAQDVLPDIKCDSIINARDGIRAIVVNGKKAGVYNLDTKAFEIPMSKQTILYSRAVGSYSLITKKGIHVWMEGEVGLEDQSFENEGQEIPNFFVRRIDEDRYTYHAVRPSNMFYDQDDTPNLIPGLGESGIYNLKKGEWEIPNIYSHLYEVNNYIFALRTTHTSLSDDPYSLEIVEKVTYDLYQRTDDGWKLEKEDIRKVDEFQLTDVLDCDVMFESADFVHFVTWKDKKAGLVRIQLYDKLHPEHANFVYHKIFSNEYDYILFEPSDELAVTYKRDLDSAFTLHRGDADNWEKSTYEILGRATSELKYHAVKSVIYHLQEDDLETEYFNQRGEDEGFVFFDRRFGLKLLNDSILSVSNYYADGPKKLRDELGNDMYNEYEQIAYDENFYGYERSGVFNLRADKYEVVPRYKECHPAKDGWVTANTIVDVDYSSYPSATYQSEYTIQNFDATARFSGLSRYDLMSEEYLPEVFEEEVDTIFACPESFAGYEQKAMYFYQDNKLGVLKARDYFNDELYTVLEKQDFIHINTNDGHTFYVKDDSLILRFNDVKLSIPATNGSLKIMYPTEHEKGPSVIATTEKDTSFVYGSPIAVWDNWASVKIEGDVLLVNDYHKDYLVYDDFFGEGYWSEREQENASVWKKMNGQWQKMTPYYAEVSSIPFGYIVRTAMDGGQPQFDENGEVIYSAHGHMEYSNEVESRSILLKKDFTAFQFMDWFDFEEIKDLGFGIMIKMNESYMFMDYDGNAITDAEWDTFEMQDNQLKAIKLRQLFDEWGDFYFDENGNVIDDPVEKFELFDLPKK